MSFDLATIKPYKYVLLTGAGFSYSFGGLLASEFRSRLFARLQVQERPQVLALLNAEPSFENALAAVRGGEPYDKADADALESAVSEVFRSMDDDIRGVGYFRGPELNLYSFQEFVSRFQCPVNSEWNAGFIFTLNQDLALERRWYNSKAWTFPPSIPGPSVNLKMNQEGKSYFMPGLGQYTESFETDVPDVPGLDMLKHTNYVKLHGSMNWRTPDGQRAMVIGTGKTEQIKGNALLREFQRLFRHVVVSNRVRLMVVGYGFQDEHINKVIVDAIRAGTSVWVWDPYYWQVIQPRLQALGIENNIMGMTTNTMNDLFPNGNHEPSGWQDIRQKFFQEQWSRQ